VTRIGSLCTGYGGLDMAVQQVFGGELAWVADNDPGATATLTHHHPHVPNLGDLTTTKWEDVEPVDILCGGYPCQPFSSAGLRKGTDDARHIWPHIAHALRVLRPRVAVFENVAGHLRLGFDAVLADLARLGFDAQWCLVRASEVGAPHRRERLFLLAWPSHPESAGRAGLRVRGRVAERGAAPADTDSERGHGRTARAGQTGREVSAGHAAADTDGGRLAGYGELPAGRNAVWHGQRDDVDGCGPAAAADTDRLGLRPDEPELRPGQPNADWGRFDSAIRRWEHATGRPAPRATDDRDRLSPAFVEWLMGLPAGHVTDVPELSRTAQLKALGNGVVPQQAAAALRLLLDRTASVATRRCA
jgi:DNA (cytosine-5)-methyltransferase 1